MNTVRGQVILLWAQVGLFRIQVRLERIYRGLCCIQVDLF